MRRYTLNLPADSLVIGTLYTENDPQNSPCISINSKVCGSVYANAGGKSGSSATCTSYLNKGSNTLEFTGRLIGLTAFRGSIFVLPN